MLLWPYLSSDIIAAIRSPGLEGQVLQAAMFLDRESWKHRLANKVVYREVLFVLNEIFASFAII